MLFPIGIGLLIHRDLAGLLNGMGVDDANSGGPTREGATGMSEGRSRTARRRARRALAAAAVLGALAAAWLGGLVWFAGQIPRSEQVDRRATDAIVVLTGSPGRIETGVARLMEGCAARLFVSGVFPATDPAEISRTFGIPEEILRCCVTLGYAASDTRGNAAETVAWMRSVAARSLRLVTANYHMPRSLVEFRRAAPDLEIVPDPVIAPNFRVEEWWRWPGTARLLIQEYHKFIVALAREPVAATLFVPLPPPLE